MTARARAAVTTQEVLRWLKKKGTRKNRLGMVRYGLPSTKTFGVSMATMQPEARRIGTNHQLALALWKTGWYEARIMSAFVGDPEQVTPALMDAWCRDFGDWGTTDTVLFKLFDRAPDAWKMVPRWVKQQGEFQKRAGFVMMACLAAHDKTAPDTAFMKCFPMIERGASDGRNFVKKGVSWALRHIGHRNAALHAAAVKTATKLSMSDDATERWIGKDALRDIQRPMVLKKVAARSA